MTRTDIRKPSIINFYKLKLAAGTTKCKFLGIRFNISKFNDSLFE